MKRFRWLTLLVPVVFALAASTGASASTSPQAPAVVAPLATPSNTIINVSSGLGLGVIHEQDGTYTYGNYDAVLPAGQSSASYFAWTTTAAGWYTLRRSLRPLAISPGPAPIVRGQGQPGSRPRQPGVGVRPTGPPPKPNPTP